MEKKTGNHLVITTNYDNQLKEELNNLYKYNKEMFFLVCQSRENY